MLYVLILCIHKPHLSWKWNGKFTHNFFSVLQLIRGLFRRYFNGSSYKLLSNEGEIIESNKSLEEGSHTWFESTVWSYKRRDWWKRWQISKASALTEILTTCLWCTVLHKTCTGLLDFQKLEKDLQCKECFFYPLKPFSYITHLVALEFYLNAQKSKATWKNFKGTPEITYYFVLSLYSD